MNNEPVAWMDYLEHSDVYDLNVSGRGIPLYTHPVKELDEQFKKGFEAGKEEGWKAHKFHHPVKELTMTEDEVRVLWNEQSSHPIDFARAILRKAQEK